jgi:uncharacterized protein (TIGR02246 family)
MRRTSLVTILVFVAGLGIGYFARSAGISRPHRTDTHAADLVAIEKLHTADMEVTLTQDPNSMANLFSDDAVNLGFPAPVVGKKAIQEAFAKFRTENPDFKVLKYVTDIKDVQFADGWAIEVVYTEATYKMSVKDNPVNFPRTPGMRVLKRQGDGSWKFALVGLK